MDIIYMCVWLQRLCEESESVDDLEGESSKVEVGTNGRVEKGNGENGNKSQK